MSLHLNVNYLTWTKRTRSKTSLDSCLKNCLMIWLNEKSERATKMNCLKRLSCSIGKGY